MKKLIYGNDSVVATYDYYTLDQAFDLVENISNFDRRRKAEKRKREKEVFFIKQKLCGFALSVVGMLPIFLEADATFLLFAIPLGLLLMTSRRRVINL